MPDEPRTVRKTLDRLGWWEQTAEICDADDPAQDEARAILDAHIIPGSQFVVTQEGLEEAAKAVRHNVLVVSSGRAHLATGDCRTVATAAITACGGVVVNKTAVVRSAGNFACKDAEGRHDVLPLFPGDKLFIKRKKEEE